MYKINNLIDQPDDGPVDHVVILIITKTIEVGFGVLLIA